MPSFVSQPHNEQRALLELAKGFYNNDGDYAHTPADGQMVKSRLNKSENNQAVIILMCCTFSKDCVQQSVGGVCLNDNKGRRVQKTHLKRSHQPPGFALEHYKYKREVKVLQCLSF